MNVLPDVEVVFDNTIHMGTDVGLGGRETYKQMISVLLLVSIGHFVLILKS